MSKLSNKVRVALDVDDVIANTSKEVVRIWNHKTGKNYKIEDVASLNPKSGMIEPIGMTFKELYEICLQVWNDNWERIEPLADSNLLEKFTKFFIVDLVTTTNARNGIEKWFKRFYPKLNLNLVIIEPYGNKAKLDYEIYVDDAPYLAELMRDYPDKKLFLVKKSWNDDVKLKSENIIFTDSVNDAFKLIISKYQSRKVDL